MIVIQWKETLEQEMRRMYDIPYSVPVDEFPSYMGKKMAERICENLKSSMGDKDE